MKNAFLLLILLLSATDDARTLRLPPELKDYPAWKRISPPGYFIPANLAVACIAPDTRAFSHVPDAPIGSSVLVDVYANPLAENHLFSTDAFPEGSIIVKNKHVAAEHLRVEDGTMKTAGWQRKQSLGVGVMIKGSKGSSPATGDWAFAYYPSTASSDLSHCAQCHQSAPHDFVFARYLAAPRH